MTRSTRFAALVSLVFACGCSTSTPPAAPTADQEVAQPASSASGETGPNSQPPEESGERLAYVQCEEPRRPMCTKEYRPVCADVDTGVRCITEPCPSTEKRQFGNGCMACAEAKVVGYFPVSCEELSSRATE